jgi:enoyl-CoA hydratase
MNTENLVGYVVGDAVATLTLDSPANRNALSAQLVAELSTRLSDADGDSGVRAIVLTHTGTTFCAGNDLTEATAEGGARRTTERLVDLLGTLVNISKPVIARVDGHVRAGGLGLLGACDMVLAGTGSTFAFTESRLGLAPAIISLTTLSRMPERAAARYYLTGETFDGAVAERIGLITEYAPDLDAALARMLLELRACSPAGLTATKQLVTGALRASLAADGPAMLEMSAHLFASESAQEGMRAFLEKRPPAWVLPEA